MKIKYLDVIVSASLLCLGSLGLLSATTWAFPLKITTITPENSCTRTNPCAQLSKSAPQVYIESASGLAIRGTDPVAYFKEGKAVQGSSKFEYKWKEATWRFSTAENQKQFAENPEIYAPQYGGYCAKALSEGNLASIDPEAWKIVNGKLYLNYSPKVQQEWIQDIPGNIAKADANWPDILVGGRVFE
ncbi:MAG: YHS domain-containing (seleno)protein [Crocosphaera sp.]|jgi:YHS domain-containing protein